MYAVIEVGAKQYTVKKGDLIDVEKQVAKADGEVTLDKVLMVVKDADVQLGQPYVKNATVTASVIDHLKGPKCISFKYRRRKSSHSTKGHRQQLTRLRIQEISRG